VAKIDWKRLIIFSIFEHHANNPVVSYHQFIILLLYMAISFRSIPALQLLFFSGRFPKLMRLNHACFDPRNSRAASWCFAASEMGGKNVIREKHWMIKLKFFFV